MLSCFHVFILCVERRRIVVVAVISFKLALILLEAGDRPCAPISQLLPVPPCVCFLCLFILTFALYLFENIHCEPVRGHKNWAHFDTAEDRFKQNMVHTCPLPILNCPPGGVWRLAGADCCVPGVLGCLLLVPPVVVVSDADDLALAIRSADPPPRTPN